MKKSEHNLSVIENFILHITKVNKGENVSSRLTLTPEKLYRMASDYIREDHVDGEDNPNDEIIIPTYSIESSFKFEDKDEEYPEQIVVVADYGDEVGTETIGSVAIGEGRLDVAVKDVIRRINEDIKNY